LFDSSWPGEGKFRGEVFANWLKDRLPSWESSVVEEDWGWALCIRKGKYRCLIAVYDYETNDSNDDGPRWIIRVSSDRFWDLFKSKLQTVQPEVMDEIVTILKSEERIADVRVEPLD